MNPNDPLDLFSGEEQNDPLGLFSDSNQDPLGLFSESASPSLADQIPGNLPLVQQPDDYLKEPQKHTTLSEDMDTYSQMPFYKRAAYAPLDIAGGILETAATGIPMAVTAAEHGARQLYGKVAKDLSGEELQKFSADSWLQKNVAPKLAPETMTGKAIADAFDSAVMQLPSNIIGATKAAIEGTGQTGAQENVAAMSPGIREWTDPALEIGLAGTVGHHLYKGLTTSTKQSTPTPTPKIDIVDPAWQRHMDSVSPGEKQFLEKISTKQDTLIQDTNTELATLERQVVEDGFNVQSEFELNQVQERLSKLIKDKVELEAKMSDQIADPVYVEQKVAELSAKLMEGRKPPTEAVVEPKVSPPEVAVTKIEEALGESREKVQTRLEKTLDKLDNLELDNAGKEDVPGSEYSSLKAALLKEVEVYKAILEKNKDTHDSLYEPTVAETIGVRDKVSTKENPTMEVLRDTIGHFTTFSDAVKKITDAGFGGAGTRTLFALLDRLPWLKETRILFSDIKVPGDSGGLVFGRYHKQGNVIRMFDDLNHSNSVTVLLHEAVHAATVHLLTTDSKFTKGLNLLYETFKEKHGNEINPNTGKPYYGFKNLEEFVAEAFSSPSFQKLLKGIDSISQYTHKADSLWNQFKDFVKAGLKAFDSTTRTALDDVMENGIGLIEEARNTPTSVFHKMNKEAKESKTFDSVQDVGIRALDAAVNGVKQTGLKVFASNNIAQFFREHPAVQQVHTYIRRASDRADYIHNIIMFGNQYGAEKIKLIDTFSKIKGEESAYMQLKNASNMDMYVVHNLFVEGFRKLNYEDNLAQNGSHLSDKQVTLYKAIAKLEEDKWKWQVNEQNKLGKKHITDKVKGYYSAVRQGEFHVEVGYGETLAHVQYFATRLAAERFIQKFGDVKYLQISDVLTKETMRPETNAQMIDIFIDALARKGEVDPKMLHDTRGDLLEKMQARGGKMGKHQEFRTNVEGYKGSEMFMTPEELGHSFKNGIQAGMADFQNNIKSLIIKTDVDPYITDLNLKAKDPIGHDAIQQLYNNALGRNKDLLKPATDPMNHAVNQAAQFISEKILGKEYKSDTGVGASSQQALTTLFYLTKMVPKFAFAILGQLFSIPQTVRVASYDGQGLRALKSFATGLGRLATRDKELFAALEEESQRYNTFEPGIIEQFDLVKNDDSKMVASVKDWLLLQKPAKAMDSFSRVASYAILYDHYKSIGLDEYSAREKARWGVGEAQNLYDTSNQPAIFKHLGAVGSLAKPLQSYAQNYFGNVIADLQYLKVKDWNTWGPIVNFTLMNVITGGVLSLPLMQEYETIRKFINSKFSDVTLPSILDLFARDGSFLDKVEPASEEARNAIIYGAASGYSGIDLAVSVRANETYMTVIAAVLAGEKGFTDLVPIVGGATQMVGGAVGVAKSLVTDVPVGERKKNMSSLMPAGHLGYLANELQGNNVSNIGGEQTQQRAVGTKSEAGGERTWQDKVGGLMGTQSIESKKGDLVRWEQTNREKIRKEKMEKYAILAVETGKGEEYVRKMAQLEGAQEQEIKGALETAGWKRAVPQEWTSVIDKKGNVSKGGKERNLLNAMRFRKEE